MAAKRKPIRKKSASKRSKAKKTVVKKVVVKGPTRAVKKQLKSISKKLEKSKKQSSRRDKKLKAAVAKNKAMSNKIQAELEKLQQDIAKSKGKKNKKQLNEYNLFMRRQLLKGKTFNQAVQLWKKLRNVEAGKMPTRTRIKTVVKRVRVKSRPKVVVRTRRILVKSKPKVVVRTRRVLVKPRPKIRTRTVVKTRTVVRKAKPVIQYKARTRTVSKPVVHTVEKPVFDAHMMEQFADLIAKETAQKVSHSMDVSRAHVSRAVTDSTLSFASHDLATEEMAYRMVKMYFEELARIGFKRQMSLDDLVDAFIYSWYRVEKRLGRKHETVHREEIAYRLVNLFFIELARVGHKRTLNLDELLDAYFYVLDRMGKDNTELIQKMEASRMQTSSSTTTITTTTTQAPTVVPQPSESPAPTAQ